MSRVFSRRPGRRFPLVPALGFVGGRGPSLGNERDAGTASRSREVRPPRKKALDPPQPGQGCSQSQWNQMRLQELREQQKQHTMGSGASAGECAAAAAGECVFGSIFADMAPPGTALLWPCLLMPMVKGMSAGHQQALTAQAEQRRI